MKRNFSVIFILLACIMMIGCFTGFIKKSALADEITELNTKSKAAYLIEPESGTIIYSSGENKRMPIASMCKIMTLLLCFESIDNGELRFDEKILISNTAAGMGGSQVFLEANAEYLAGDLIKSIVVASANDACVAMAERICGTEAEFVNLMNKKAKALNMNDTVFVNCTGLPCAGQYSSASDVAKMFIELTKHQDYFKFSKIWTDKIFHPKDRVTDISNTNKLVRFYQGCEGGKTGYTVEAGHCLAAVACKNNTKLISIVIGAPDSKTRFFEVSSMFNYGFTNYVNKVLIDKNTPLELSVKVEGGKKDTISVIAEHSFNLFTKKGEKRAIETEFVPIEKIKAPIKQGDLVGHVNLYENGIKIKEISVLSNEDVLKKTYFDMLKDVINNWAL